MEKNKQKTILFLQGPPSLFARKLAGYLESRGARCLRINFAFSDWCAWLGKPSVNYRGTLDAWPEFLRAFLTEHKVNTVLYFADCLPYHRMAREVADDLGIEAVTYEFGYLRPNWITLERGGMSRYSHFPTDPDHILQQAQGLPLPPKKKVPSTPFWVEAWHEVTYNLGNYLFHLTFPNYQADKYYNPLREYLNFIPRLLREKENSRHAKRLVDQLLQEKRPFWLFPLQLQSDYQIRVNSPFERQSEAMEMVIKAFSKSADSRDWLLFKVHPMDNGIEPWNEVVAELANRYAVAGRVHLIDGGNLAAMLKHCRGVVTINSTVGLHALQADSPTKVLGYAMYDIAGLTSQQPLEDFFQQPQGPDSYLLDAFVRLVAATIQVRGNFYTKEGRTIAFKQMAEKLFNSTVNLPGAYIDPPPRLTT